jgi:hypothetical protein
MAALSVTFGKELSQPLTDIYWDALKGVFVEQFQEAAKYCIKYNRHFPKPVEIMEAIQATAQTAPKKNHELPPADRKWLGWVNAMFLQYLTNRRIKDKFPGDINLEARRAECLSLVEFFELLEADGDSDATEAEMRTRFDRAMGRIPDKSQDVGWLDAQLEFQRNRETA